MGDMADMAIEQGIAQMTDQDYEPDYDPGLDCFGDVPTVRRGSMNKVLKCRHCGETDLEWSNGTGYWRMIDSEGELHSCQEYRDTRDE